MKPLNKTTYRVEQSLESYACSCTWATNCNLQCNCLSERLSADGTGGPQVTSNSSAVFTWGTNRACTL